MLRLPALFSSQVHLHCGRSLVKHINSYALNTLYWKTYHASEVILWHNTRELQLCSKVLATSLPCTDVKIQQYTVGWLGEGTKETRQVKARHIIRLDWTLLKDFKYYYIYACFLPAVLFTCRIILAVLCDWEALINKVTELPVIASIYSLKRTEVDRE